MSQPSDPGRRPREAVVVAALLALVFLLIIAASVGYIVRHRAGGGTSRAGSPSGTGAAPAGPTTGLPAPSTAGPSTAGPSGGDGRSPAGATPPPGAPPGPAVTPVGACPEVTERAARLAGSPGGLRTVRYALTGRSEVWVCRDSAGRLWYQGHQRSAPLDAASSSSSLLLADVAAEPAGGYVATNAGAAGTLTRYHVSPATLVVEFVDASGVVTGSRTEQVLVTGGT